MPNLVLYPSSVVEATWTGVANLVGNTEAEASNTSNVAVAGTVANFVAAFDFSVLPENAYITGITGGLLGRSQYYANSRETYALTLNSGALTGVITENRQTLTTSNANYLIAMDLALARTRGYTDEVLRAASEWTFTLLSKVAYTEGCSVRKLWLDVEYEIASGNALFFGEAF